MTTATTPPPVEPEYRDIGGSMPMTGLVAVAITTRRPQLIEIQINEIKAGKPLSVEHQITLLKLIQDWITPAPPSEREKKAEALADAVAKATETLTDLAARVTEIE